MLLDRFEPLVVPVRIRGTYEAMPVGKAIPRLRRVSVHFGEPVQPAKLREEGRGETGPERIVNALYERMARGREAG
jgi:1-acyl-sn-glycerol-3-phosphate acyltransferase